MCAREKGGGGGGGTERGCVEGKGRSSFKWKGEERSTKEW